VGASDHGSPAPSRGASCDPRAWQTKSFLSGLRAVFSDHSRLIGKFRAERTWIGGESTCIGSLPGQTSPVKSHRASLSRQTMGIGEGIRGEGEATPEASTAKGRGKCPWDALTVLIKNTASERLPQRSKISRPSQKGPQGPRHFELCSRRSVLITYHCINVLPPWTGARRGVRAGFNLYSGEPLRLWVFGVFGHVLRGECGRAPALSGGPQSVYWASECRQTGARPCVGF